MALPRHCCRGSRLSRQPVRPPWVNLACFAWITPDLPYWPTDAYRESPSRVGLPGQYSLVSGFCSSLPRFVISFFQIPPHGGHPCLDGRFPCIRGRRRLSPPACETCQAHTHVPTTVPSSVVPSSGFVQMVVGASPSTTDVEIVVGGAAIRVQPGFDPALLRAVVAALGAQA